MANLAHEEAENRKFTCADYKSRELKKGERFELIYGEAYAMAAPFDLRRFYEADESDDTMVKPDPVVVCDPEKLGPE
ncbi:MAG: hypothetical protein LBS57_07885 [Treponema sp.]|jgi:hypothetical protein|nr:hypothetical protein [Treponema sp.]